MTECVVLLPIVYKLTVGRREPSARLSRSIDQDAQNSTSYRTGGSLFEAAHFIRNTRFQTDDMPRQARKHNTSKYTPLPPRPAKGKTDEPEISDHSMSLYWNAPPSLPILLEWLKQQGIWLSEKLQVKEMQDGQGWGVVSTQVGVPLEVGSFRPI